MSKTNLKAHILIHFEDRPHICHICSASFKTKSKLQFHQHKHSEIREFICSNCFKAFKTKNDLNQHEKIHNSGPSECADCLQIFASRKSFDGHRRTCEFKPPKEARKKKEYYCDLCQKSFSKSSHLKVNAI